MYTKEMYKNEIRKLIASKGYDPAFIGNKTYDIFVSHIRELEEGLQDKLLIIAGMEGGPEFELTETEFNEFIEKL